MPLGKGPFQTACGSPTQLLRHKQFAAAVAVKLSKTKTARFASVVQSCGRPETFTPWSDPTRDKTFLRAVRQNRVLTIKHDPGTRRDFGVVGFIKEPRASLLISAKSLRRFQNRRIIGIKYDLLKPAEPIGPIAKPESFAPARSARRLAGRTEEWDSARAGIRPVRQPHSRRPKVARSSPERKRFVVVFRFTAQAETAQEVEAVSRPEAQSLAEQRVLMPDFSRGTVTRKIVRIREQK